jgi:hypothetical protein
MLTKNSFISFYFLFVAAVEANTAEVDNNSIFLLRGSVMNINNRETSSFNKHKLGRRVVSVDNSPDSLDDPNSLDSNDGRRVVSVDNSPDSLDDPNSLDSNDGRRVVSVDNSPDSLDDPNSLDDSNDGSN